MKKPAKLDNYIVAHLKDHPNEYVQVSFPKFIFYPVGTRKICLWCGSKRLITKMSPIPILTDSHIDWECQAGCFDVSESPSVEVQS
jgi:hypothetical protein